MAFVAVEFVEQSPLGWIIASASVVTMALISGVDRVYRPARVIRKRTMRSEAAADLIAGEVAPGPNPIVPDPGDLGSRFSRIVVLAIALATLTAAWIGYVQADAFGHADQVRFGAQKLALDALIKGEHDEDEAMSQVEAYGLATKSVVAVWGGEQVMRYEASPLGSPTGHHDAETELEHLRTTADAMTALVTVNGTAYGPAKDPDFPEAFLANAAASTTAWSPSRLRGQ